MTSDLRERPELDQIWVMLQEQREEIVQQRASIQAQQQEIGELRRQNERLQIAAQQPEPHHVNGTDKQANRVLSRAGMLKAATAGAAATVGAGAMLQTRAPLAAAATGSAVIAGQQTTAENSTSIYYDSTTATGVIFLVDDNGSAGLSSPYTAAVGGWSTGSGGTASGVYGYTTVPGGNGVVGWSNDTSTTNSYGVYGRVENSGGTSAGVYGEAKNGTPGLNTTGVYGRCEGTSTSSANGNGVYGYHTGGGYGVYGESVGGHGVYGLAYATGKGGVTGSAMGSNAYAIFGNANGNSQAYAGVFIGNVSITGGSLAAHNPLGHAILGTSDAPHYGGLSGATTVSGGAGLIGTNSNVAGAYGGLIYGPLVVTGTKSAAVQHPDGTRRLVYCVEMPESFLEDVGEASLTNGKATVHLAKDFAELIDSGHYYVFLTERDLQGEGLVVTHFHNDRFVVQERKGGRSSGSFQYRVMAKRGDVTAERLAPFNVPEPNIAAAMHKPEISATPDRKASHGRA